MQRQAAQLDLRFDKNRHFFDDDHKELLGLRLLALRGFYSSVRCNPHFDGKSQGLFTISGVQVCQADIPRFGHHKEHEFLCEEYGGNITAYLFQPTACPDPRPKSTKYGCKKQTHGLLSTSGRPANQFMCQQNSARWSLASLGWTGWARRRPLSCRDAHVGSRP
jgi:hypothetical protein